MGVFVNVFMNLFWFCITDGIDITPWSPDERIVFSAWDFAGQDGMERAYDIFSTLIRQKQAG